MYDCKMRRRLLRLALAMVSVIPLGLASCSVESPPEGSLYDVGVLEGYALAAGRGMPLEISARNLYPYGSPWDGPSTQASTVADSTGWYRLELPSGSYRLSMNYSEGDAYTRGWGDTVAVVPGANRHDLRFGWAAVRIQLPPQMEGKRVSLEFEGPQVVIARMSARVQDGVAALDMPLLLPGAYLMNLDVPNATGDFYLPGSAAAADADTLIVEAGQVAAYAADLSGRYAAVSGRVTGSWQVAPWTGMQVVAYTSESRQAAYASCDEEGDFTLGLLAPMVVRLLLSCGSVERWYGGESYDDARIFALQPGDHIADVTEVESGLEVQFAGSGEQIVYGGRLLVRDAGGREYGPFQMPYGSLWICNLIPGRYYVQADGRCAGQSWADQWYDGAATPADATPLDLAAGELRLVVMDLAEGGRLAGDLLFADGGRPEEVNVRLCDAGGEPVCSSSSYFADGAYRFSGLSVGDYHLKTVLGGGDPWWYPGTGDFAAAVPIRIDGPGTVPVPAWMLPASAGKGRP